MSEGIVEDLRPWGWAPGSYLIRCMECPAPTQFADGPMGDKRAWRCETHARQAREQSMQDQPAYAEGKRAAAQEAAAHIEAQAAEIASLRLTLGGRTFSADVPEPIGCPMPGACAQVAEIARLRREVERLRVVVRVNALRQGATDAEIAAVLDPEDAP